ncbi:hypothetical protein [Kutzneria sp. NPDC052558]|uniref:hypothetical protein n=1 Tax=Kutzneria sp. NPDC052558 TaxID=3364121 RepID=UPI0037C8EF2F
MDDPAAAVDIDHYAAHVDMLHQVQEQITRLSKLRGDLQADIKRALGDAEVGLIAGLPAVTNRTTLRTSLSAKAVKRLWPWVARACSETRPVTTFLLVS